MVFCLRNAKSLRESSYQIAAFTSALLNAPLSAGCPATVRVQ